MRAFRPSLLGEVDWICSNKCKTDCILNNFIRGRTFLVDSYLLSDFPEKGITEGIDLNYTYSLGKIVSLQLFKSAAKFFSTSVIFQK